MWPRITHRAEGTTRPKASLTHKSTHTDKTPSSNLTNPGLQATCGAPASSRTKPLTAIHLPHSLALQGRRLHWPLPQDGEAQSGRNLQEPYQVQ